MMIRKQVQNLLLLIAISAGTATADTSKPNGEGAIIGKDSTNIDFSAANIDGKMQAPSGFFLQGREAQAMTQMVKLRAKFRSELRNSKSAVKDIAH